ncbi:MAG: hypothetical protein OXH50_07400 [Gemmatimonadetes bacterium]|nr:hypothetical protein [Gemmatimonadota bacterium]
MRLSRPYSSRTRRPWKALAAILLASVPAQLHAGAWTQPPGGLYLKVAGLSFRSGEFLNAEGERLARQEKPSTEELTDRNATVYLEYGVRERLTLVASLPYKRLVHKKTEVRHFESLDTTITRIYPDEKESGFADLEMRLRWRLLEDPAVVSVTLGGKLPLGYEMQEESNVPLGTAEIDGDTRLLVGKSLYPLPGYVTSAIGYRRRGGIFSDEFLYSFEAGFTYGNLLVKGVAEGVRTFGDCGATGAMGMLIGDQNSLKLAPGIIWSLSERLELGADLFHIVSGCNTAAGTTWALGLAFKR